MVDDREKLQQETLVAKSEEVLQVKPTGSGLALTQELLDQKLVFIREHFKKADKNLELAILDQDIRVRNGGEVVLEVMGHMQEEIADKMKPELVGLIRQFTGAERVLILIELKEELESGAPKLYTNTDKLNHLREKHPALKEMQRRFGLEVDF